MRALDDFPNLQQFLDFKPGLVAHALGAIGTVLRASAGLYAEQRADLHGVRHLKAAVNLLGAEQEVHERERE